MILRHSGITLAGAFAPLRFTKYYTALLVEKVKSRNFAVARTERFFQIYVQRRALYDTLTTTNVPPTESTLSFSLNRRCIILGYSTSC